VNADLWRVRGRELEVSARTLVMGVLNVTPDSFSDGGRFPDAAAAVEAGLAMADAGADIVDVGGESSRPGRAEIIDDAEECRRVIPVVEALRARLPAVAISVDTFRLETARRALDAGADIINDITALRRSPGIAALCAAHGAGLVLMHMLGDPLTMQEDPRYDDVVVDVKNFLRDRMDFALAGGVPEECIAVDPGIGFGKTAEHNVRLLAGLDYLRLLQRPIVVGASRKRFLGSLTGSDDPQDRLEASLAAACAASLGGAGIVRVHDVLETRRALAVIDAIRAEQ
jgi:dihydropteroate synthase